MSSKQRKSTGPSSRAQDETGPNAMSTEAALPQESSFQNLRQKIEGNLKKTESKSKNKKGTGQKKETQSSPPESADARGKKRNRNGEVKEQGSRAQSMTKPKLNGAPEEAGDAVDLKAIVAELGGTQEDIDLIDGANSDSELEGLDTQPAVTEQTDSKKGKTLESGMANILKEIALVRDTYGGSDSEDEPEVKVNGSADSARPLADDKPSRIQKDDDEIKIKSAATELQNGKIKKTKLRCTPRPDWFNHELPDIDTAKGPPFTPSPGSVEQLHSHARILLQTENEMFKSTQMSSSSQAFYNTVIASGTLSDKVSALTLAVQESPLHNMKSLEGLLGLAQKRSRAQAVDVLRALKDLFAQGSMLPSDRKLQAFATRPDLLAALGQTQKWNRGDHLPVGVQEAHLIVWAYEDWLKEQYFEVLKVLETWCNDEIEFAKTRATSYVYELLKEKPEQEANLLRLLINKLGDPVKKIASQASYLIMQLLSNHPAMKEIVISAIDTDFIFKPGQSTHARYYAAVTLNQTALSMDEEAVAIKLLEIYFGLFKLLLKPGEEKKEYVPPKATSRHQRQRKQAASMPSTEQEDELREKLISAVLTGVNRAYPYCGTDHQKFSEHIDTLFQITHSANFNTSIQAMMLIQQLISNTTAPSDRFYRTLYESLLDPRLLSSSKQQLYLNLLHRSLKADLSQKRVKAFAKRILQILSLQDPSFVCAAFFLLKDLEKTFPSLSTMLDQPEDHDDDEEVFRDADVHPARFPIDAEPNTNNTTYDAAKRDPSHANADTSAMWDVLPYLAHYHPSVIVSADHILDHKALPGKPDLALHTLIHFLDRFVYKNAKLSGATKMRGSSIMQPMASEDTRAVLLSAGGSRKAAVNSAEFLAKKDGDVAAEDVFFHQYFKTMGKSAAVGKKPKKAKDEDVDEEGSDDEDEVWKAMVNNAPDLEGLGDDDEDEISDMEEFEEAMDEDEDMEEAGEEDIDEEMDSDAVMGMEDEDGSVDIEAGIFDESEDEADGLGAMNGDADEDESDFEGLSDDDAKDKKPSQKTLQKREDRDRKKKMKALPTFASAADYQKMLDNDEDEDLG
ncbi:RNA-binding ribosome biosynthesis protein mak21 [Knufia obscura]|uniref:RNA-binding ribosome biosynthesis protein mak21 n=1 Tax=Knufia obscura TaxID=1635080 RepID=A0ABR0RF88_9EURO|nr:RNA-binding ribosome biosynthesis protein mak21 [Knufia obscura]